MSNDIVAAMFILDFDWFFTRIVREICRLTNLPYLLINQIFDIQIFLQIT